MSSKIVAFPGGPHLLIEGYENGFSGLSIHGLAVMAFAILICINSSYFHNSLSCRFNLCHQVGIHDQVQDVVHHANRQDQAIFGKEGDLQDN